ncbi:dienelactone hydrolase family protein [Streptomyces viridiviolaceus]
MISDTVSVPADHVTLDAHFAVPASARAVVLLPHGADTVWRNERSRSVADRLHTAGFATLLVDLLSEREVQGDTQPGFDAGVLPRRIVAAVDWVRAQPETRKLPVVLFGAGTQADVVLEAAADLPDGVLTVVLWGARPDPDADAIQRLRIPVLFIVGGQEPELLRLTEEAAHRLEAPHAVRVVTGATHLFEEPGALDQVVSMAGDWCDEQLRSAPGPE